jgi:hypothetical protein
MKLYFVRMHQQDDVFDLVGRVEDAYVYETWEEAEKERALCSRVGAKLEHPKKCTVHEFTIEEPGPGKFVLTCEL